MVVREAVKAAVVAGRFFAHPLFCSVLELEASDLGSVEAQSFGFFLHRALAALAAIWERLRALSLAARAWPPLSPPRRPRETAAGFLGASAGGSYFGA